LGDVLERAKTVNPALKPNQEFFYIDLLSVNIQTFLFKGLSQLTSEKN